MAVKFTPGPWTFGHWGNDFWVGPDKFGLGLKVARVTWGMGEEIEQGRQNARLIAAAPDLLLALKAILPSASSDGFVSEGVISNAYAAIFKATGEA